MQVLENGAHIVEHAVLLAPPVKQGHQFRVSGAVDLILIPIGTDVALLQAGKVAVQLGVEILPVAAAQGQTQIEAQNAFDPGVYAGIQNSVDVLPGKN